MTDEPKKNRLDELLAERAVFGLDLTETKELEKLIDLAANQDDESFELAAAMIDISITRMEPIPTPLKQKLIEQGRANMLARSDENFPHAVSLGHADSKQNQRLFTRGNKIREVIAWSTAIAIGFIAFMIWAEAGRQLASVSSSAKQAGKDFLDEINELKSSLKDAGDYATRLEVANQELKKQLSPDGKEVYDELVGKTGVIQWAWSATGNSKASGDVVWNQAKQKGAMRFVNLEKNDPNVSQYQLWIIEETGRKHPVDGGVFDVTSDIEIFIPIDSKLFANPPKAFAVTVERRNGVVVSTRENLPLIAMATTNTD